jgi:transcription antitermination factor NusG
MSEASNGSKSWFAVQTRYRSEQRVFADLMQKGVEAYLPLLEEVHRWKDRRKRVQVPAFSGYLFVSLAGGVEPRVRVLETEHVLRILGTARGPVEVDRGEIETLQAALRQDAGFVRHPFLVVGERVRVCRGPLQGITGLLEHFKNGARLVLSVATVSQSISTEVSMHDVEPVSGGIAVA